jgi:hypothetical protein
MTSFLAGLFAHVTLYRTVSAWRGNRPCFGCTRSRTIAIAYYCARRAHFTRERLNKGLELGVTRHGDLLSEYETGLLGKRRGAVVLGTTMDTGSTAIAAANAGRRLNNRILPDA